MASYCHRFILDLIRWCATLHGDRECIDAAASRWRWKHVQAITRIVIVLPTSVAFAQEGPMTPSSDADAQEVAEGTDERSTSKEPAREPTANMPTEPSSLGHGPQSAASASSKPWRAHEALGLPWLRFGLEQRSRFEHLKDDFRSSSAGNASGMFLRTLLSTELHFAPLVIGAELQDSRAYATEQTPLNNSLVNPMDVLQAYASVRRDGLFMDDDALSLKVGRFTMDVGSRRLVARNSFRNTINSFTGADLQWTSSEQHMLRTFLVAPVQRLPTDAGALKDNKAEFDRESKNTLLWGAFFGSAPLPANVQLEAYVLGLHEWDDTNGPSANRQLFTPGLRILRSPATGQFDVEVEAMFQFGTSRATSAPTDTTDLKHRAGLFHATCGYRFDVPSSPRLALQYDFASGDRDPNDKINGRFDPLFGARRFEFGPTGLYGALARSNISSPGIRVEIAPHSAIDVLGGYRLYWLASARDAWTTAGLRDPTGASGKFVGQQFEGKLRWNALPKNLDLELGVAYLLRGRFATSAPGARMGNPLYVYTQLTGTL